MSKLRYSFVDPLFGRESQARFTVSKVFIYGRWYVETWEEKERGEFWIRFKGMSEKFELVFPSFEARNKALENIVPDRRLDEPITDAYVERINENFTKPTTPEFSTTAKVSIVAGIGALALLGGWLFKNKKPANK